MVSQLLPAQAIDVLVWPAFAVILISQLSNAESFARYAWSIGLAGARQGMARLRAAGRTSYANTEVGKEIEKVVSQRRAQYALWAIRAAQAGASFFVCIFAAGFFQGTRTARESLSWAVTCAMLAVAGRFPRKFVAERSLPMLFAVGTLILTAALVLRTWDDTTLVGNTFAPLFFGCFYLRSSFILAANVFRLLCVLASRFADSSKEFHCGDPRYNVGEEVAKWCMQVALLYFAESLLVRSAQREVEARLEKSQQSAVSGLLDLMCDAVVDLDEDFHLKAHSPKLANMLMHGAGKSLLRMDVRDFIPEGEERNAFAASMQQDSDAGTPSMFTVRLRDSMSNFVRMVFYHVPYLTIGGHTHHFIGLKEDVDTGAGGYGADVLPPAALRPNIVREFEAGLAPLPAAALSRGGSGPGRASSSRRSSARSRAQSTYGEWQEPAQEMSMRLAMESGLPLTLMGQTLRERLHIEDPSLHGLSELMSDGGQAFEKWTMEQAAFAVENNMKQNFTARFGEMELSSPTDSEGRVRGMAFVRFTWPFLSKDGETDYVSVGLSRGQRHSAASGRGTVAAASPRPLSGNEGDAPRTRMSSEGPDACHSPRGHIAL